MQARRRGPGTPAPPRAPHRRSPTAPQLPRARHRRRRQRGRQRGHPHLDRGHHGARDGHRLRAASGPTALDLGDLRLHGAEAGSTFECKLDDGAWAACTSPRALTGLAQGAHTFRVRATDAAGNIDAERGRRAPGASTRPRPRRRSGRAVGIDRLAQRGLHLLLDRRRRPASSASSTTRPGRPATRRARSAGLAEGPHASASARWTPPATATPARPRAPGPWTRTRPETTLERRARRAHVHRRRPQPSRSPRARRGADLRVQARRRRLGGLRLPATLTGLGDGEHTFAVRAPDAAGNADATRGRPHLDRRHRRARDHDLLRAHRPHGVDLRRRSGSPRARPASSFECRLDAGAWQAAQRRARSRASPRARTLPSPRDRRRRERGRERGRAHLDRRHGGAGHDLRLGARATIASNRAEFALGSGEAGAGLECRLDDGAWEDCASPARPDRARERRAHDFRVRAHDAAGNLDPTPAEHTWTVDAEPPDTSITGGPAGTVRTTGARLLLRGRASPARASSAGSTRPTGRACGSPHNLSGLALRAAHLPRARRGPARERRPQRGHADLDVERMPPKSRPAAGRRCPGIRPPRDSRRPLDEADHRPARGRRGRRGYARSASSGPAGSASGARFTRRERSGRSRPAPSPPS